MATSSWTSELVQVDENLWEIPAEARADMRVPARIFADRELLDAIVADRSLEQLQNVATLPGIVAPALAMPDIHQGYGFPVGGVAAMELPDGVVSPGGVGYDINCGVRLLALPLSDQELGARREPLVHEISRSVPAGTGKQGSLLLSTVDLDDVLREGSRALVARGIGRDEDVELTEAAGRLDGADVGAVSPRAHERGRGQLGTLGAGNHFVELQRVDRVLDDATAEAFGLRRGAAHRPHPHADRGASGTRSAATTSGPWTTSAPVRHLASRPATRMRTGLVARRGRRTSLQWPRPRTSPSRTGRQSRTTCGARSRGYSVVRQRTRHARSTTLHTTSRRSNRTTVASCCVHRKGATRAFPAGMAEIPAAYRAVGQPVFIPGSMGTVSFVLVGEPGSIARSFGTTCHGAGRAMSRTGARRQIDGGVLRRRLEAEGIVVRSPSTEAR